MTHDTDTGSTRALIKVLLLIIVILGVTLCSMPVPK